MLNNTFPDHSPIKDQIILSAAIFNVFSGGLSHTFHVSFIPQFFCHILKLLKFCNMLEPLSSAALSRFLVCSISWF